MDNLECKTTAMSYFRKLRRLTNTAFPYKVPVCVYFASWNYNLTTGQDRYLELIRVAREWNILQAKKNCGFGPESRGSPGDGELAHFCPACPQPGINLKEGCIRKNAFARLRVVKNRNTSQHLWIVFGFIWIVFGSL